MDSLVGYGSDDDYESDRFDNRQTSGASAPASRRRDDDTNYDDVNMDLSDDSSQAESEPELPAAEPATSKSSPSQSSRDGRRGSDDSRERDREHDRDRRDRDRDRKDRDREVDRRDRDRRRDTPPKPRLDRERSDRRSPRRDDRRSPRRDDRRSPRRDERRSPRSPRRDDRRSPRRDDKHARSEKLDRSRGYDGGSSKINDKSDTKVPALMDLKPFNGDPPPSLSRSQDSRDAVSPRFADRDRRDRDRERERDRDRYSRRSEERRSSHRRERSRSRSRGAAFPPPSSSSERRLSPSSGEYRPSSYKVNKKLEVMEKMGLQIKTPDGSMATAQQLRAAAGEPPAHASHLPSYYNPAAVNTNKILDQVQKRKLLWANKNKSEAEEAAKWSGTRFAQDNDGRQVSKFMRLMGIKDPAAVNPESSEKPNADPIKKQEELFQAMQAQYDVARATTHTMRGVGLGFQRGQF